MNTVVLLGAGASVEAGVPATYEMTKEIAKSFRNTYGLQKNSEVLKFVIGGLLFQKGIDGKDPLAGINVEELFNAVQLLAERSTSEAAPFVGSWHESVTQFDKAVLPQADHLYRLILDNIAKGIFDSYPLEISEERNIDEGLKRSIDGMARGFSSSHDGVGKGVNKYLLALKKKWHSNIEKSRNTNFDGQLITALHQQLVKSGEGEIFKNTADHMINALKDIVWIEDDSDVDYLRPLLDLKRDNEKLVIATLNYDNCIELLCQRNNQKCFTGIDEWSENGTFNFQHGICLIKLHGSIDWIYQTKGRYIRHSTVKKLSFEEIKNETSFYGIESRNRPAVIFGQNNKLTAKGPFLDLLRAFKSELDNAHELIVIGYSFGDAHINEYISQWLNHDESHRVRIIDPNFESIGSTYGKEIGEFKVHNQERIEIMQVAASEGVKELLKHKTKQPDRV
ncbi:MAG: SIR2 family protein [Thermoleophilia bacterium]